EEGTVRHEYYNGKLFEMPGATLLHNEICIRLLMVLTSLIKGKGWKIYIENVKVKIEHEEIYLYPDIVLMNPTEESAEKMNDYVVHQPILLAEVLSDSTRKYDSTDKFILYQKISALRYYLLVEPEKHVVIFYEKDDAGEWYAKTYTELTEVISLLKLQAQFTLADIYS
ncbi:MAG: Uma2 family endonuclease, partial [Segetibacter sp.]